MYFTSVTERPQYNCSVYGYSPDEWTEKTGEAHRLLGVISVLYGLAVEFMYSLCLPIMCTKANFSKSCFKIMVILTINDMGSIVVNSMFTGFFLYRGEVFCSNPNLMYVVGFIGLLTWCYGCVVALILAINRMLDMLQTELIGQRVVDLLFSGNRVFIIIIIPLIYGLLVAICCPVPLFNSANGAWFFDPFIYKNDEYEYRNYVYSANNISVIGFTCVLYIWFCLALGKRIRKALSDSRKSVQNQIFMQSTFVVILNFISSSIYVTMNFYHVPPFVIILGQIFWQISQGCPAIIYLTMNKTIRLGVSEMYPFKKIFHQPHKNVHVIKVKIKH